MKHSKYIQKIIDTTKDWLIRLDEKLGGQSSTQSHASNWSEKRKA